MPNMDDTGATAQPTINSTGDSLKAATELFAAFQDNVPSHTQAKPETANVDTTEGTSPNADLAVMITQMLAARQANGDPQPQASQAISPQPLPPNTSEPAGASQAQSPLGNIATLLPIIVQAFSGSSGLIKPEKLNLVNAIKPYMNDDRSESIDRAIKMATVAQAAKSALSALGR